MAYLGGVLYLEFSLTLIFVAKRGSGEAKLKGGSVTRYSRKQERVLQDVYGYVSLNESRLLFHGADQSVLLYKVHALSHSMQLAGQPSACTCGDRMCCITIL